MEKENENSIPLPQWRGIVERKNEEEKKIDSGKKWEWKTTDGETFYRVII